MSCDPARDQNFVKVILIKGEYESFLHFLTSEVVNEIHVAEKQKETDKLVYNIEMLYSVKHTWIFSLLSLRFTC